MYLSSFDWIFLLTKPILWFLSISAVTDIYLVWLLWCIEVGVVASFTVQISVSLTVLDSVFSGFFKSKSSKSSKLEILWLTIITG